MRALFLTAILFATITPAFSGGGYGKCGPRCCGTPESSYVYKNAYFTPDCSPCPISRFHDRLLPMMEARKSGEASYIRENSERLYKSATKLRKIERGCCKIEIRRFDRAAKDLILACDELREVSYGGSSNAVYLRMHNVEEAYIRVANLAE